MTAAPRGMPFRRGEANPNWAGGVRERGRQLSVHLTAEQREWVRCRAARYGSSEGAVLRALVDASMYEDRAAE